MWPRSNARDRPSKTTTLSRDRASLSTRASSIIVGVVAVAIPALSIWYLIQPAPLLIQGEMDATQLDIAARVDGRVAEILVNEGQDVAAGAVLVRIDNPETIAKNEQALAVPRSLPSRSLQTSTLARERRSLPPARQRWSKRRQV